jgi:hypothetical protein
MLQQQLKYFGVKSPCRTTVKASATESPRDLAIMPRPKPPCQGAFQHLRPIDTFYFRGLGVLLIITGADAMVILCDVLIPLLYDGLRLLYYIS